MELYELTIHELHEKLKKREVSSVEATQACLDRIGAVEEKVHAFITVTPEEALQGAAGGRPDGLPAAIWISSPASPSPSRTSI